jgi:hypothetical protein
MWTARFPIAILICAMMALAVAPSAQAQFASPFHVIPVVAKLTGGAGTKWQSDMAITNLSGKSVNVGLQFFREAQNNSFTGDFSKTITLAPGETRLVEDILGTFFPSEGSTKGVLLILSQDSGSGDDGLLAVTTRTYNAANPSATYGQTVPSNFLGMIFGLGRSILPGVRYDSRFRTNIGVANLGPVPAPVIVKIYDASGALVSTMARTVESFSLRQWSLADLGAPNLVNGRAEVQLDTGTQGFDPCDPGSVPFVSTLLMTYFSKVDNATGDAEFGYGQLDWTDYADTCGTNPVDNCSSAATAQGLARLFISGSR